MPVTTLTTPSGRPASRHASAKSSAVSGVCSAGLSTTVLPAARMGPHLAPQNGSGKFHGEIAPTTPNGWRKV